MVEPTYDDDGNMLTYNGWTFTWNGENRLSIASNSVAGVTVQNAYDYMGRRVSKTTNNQAQGTTNQTQFVYDGWAMIREASVTTTNHYVYGLDLSGSMQGAGTIGGILMANFNGTAAFYVYDANGNVTDLVDANGSTVAHYQYDAFGNTITQTGTHADANPYRFSTKYLDEEVNLYYYGYRYYNPELGRWINRDPIEERGGKNVYAAFRNNSITRFDALGKWDEKVHYDLTHAYATQFKNSYRTIIAKANNDTDSGWTGPIISVDRHLKRNRGGGVDSRHYWYETELDKAIEYLGKRKCAKAAKSFGRGLHSKQDQSSHREWPIALGGGDWPRFYTDDDENVYVAVHPGWWDYYGSDIWSVSATAPALHWSWDALWNDHGIVDSDYYPWTGAYAQRLSQARAQVKVR